MTALLFLLSVIEAYSKDINILEAGAVPDGKFLNTVIIQSAINNVTENGGGTVIIPPGVFLTGSFVLKNNVTLELRKGAILLGSKDIKDYLSIKPRYIALRTGQATKQLIFAEDQNDIALTGEGTIDGQGEVFKRAAEGDEPGITRPHLIQLINCKNVRIEGLNMRNSGGWMQHYLACKNLIIKNINVYNHCNYNNDGIDIDGCHDVIVSGCIVDSDDDGICLKSTSPASCKNVIISDCVVKSHCNALKMGTETTGGFQNISITNCLVSPSADPDPLYGTLHGQSAISVEMVDGGLLDGINISNISITETDCPIFIRLGNRARKFTSTASDPDLGILKNVVISNVVASTTSKLTSNITGIPGGYAENIILDNILINNLSEGDANDAELVVGENDKGYPTAGIFGDVLPASGFFVRHIKNISFRNIHLVVKEGELRPAFVINDVNGAIIDKAYIFGAGENFNLIKQDAQCKNIVTVK